MKKFTAILLSMVMFVSVFAISPVSAYAKVKTYKSNNYLYTFMGEGIQILRYLGKESKVTVPTEIDGYKVVKLGVDMEDDYWSEKDILDYGAGFTYTPTLTEVTVPDGINIIGTGSFSECENLKKVTLGKGITEIKDYLFAECGKLQSVSIPTTVTRIGCGAFSKCKKLKKINIPSSVVEIDSGAFSKTGLTELHIGKNIKNISTNIYVYDVFAGTKIKKITVSKDNKKYSAKNGVLYNKSKTKLIYYPRNKKAKKFVIPKTVQKIAVGAFFDSKYLQSVVISKGIKEIGHTAFCDCKQLSKVTFKTKKDVKIGYYAFYCCKSLKKVTIPKNIKTIGSKAFGFKGKGTYGYKDYKVKNFTIKGKSGSQAQKYAKKHGFKFIAI